MSKPHNEKHSSYLDFRQRVVREQESRKFLKYYNR